MFTVQKKRRVLVVSDFNTRDTGVMSDNGVVLSEDMTELSWALSKIANDMV